MVTLRVPDPQPKVDPSPAPPPVRTKRDEYRIESSLGEGTYGVVKRCTHIPTGKKYAAKIIQKRHLKHFKFEEMVYKEVSVLRNISHENIISIFDFFETSDAFYMIFELATGGELFDKIVNIHKTNSFTEREAAVIIATVCNALAYLHDLGIVHRDIKPENLLFKTDRPDAPLTIVDFGIAQVIDTNRNMLSTVCGSPGYTAPEVLMRQPYDTKVDIYALGTVTCAFVGRLITVGYGPFVDAPDHATLTDRVVRGDYNFDSPAWDPISNLAKDFVRKCMSTYPDHRLSAHELLRHPWIVKYTPAGYLEYLRQLNVDAHTKADPQWTPTPAYTVPVPQRAPSRKIVPLSQGSLSSTKSSGTAAVSPPTPTPSPRPPSPLPLHLLAHAAITSSSSSSSSSFSSSTAPVSPSVKPRSPPSSLPRGRLTPHGSDPSISSLSGKAPSSIIQRGRLAAQSSESSLQTRSSGGAAALSHGHGSGHGSPTPTVTHGSLTPHSSDSSIVSSMQSPVSVTGPASPLSLPPISADDVDAGAGIGAGAEEDVHSSYADLDLDQVPDGGLTVVVDSSVASVTVGESDSVGADAGAGAAHIVGEGLTSPDSPLSLSMSRMATGDLTPDPGLALVDHAHDQQPAGLGEPDQPHDEHQDPSTSPSPSTFPDPIYPTHRSSSSVDPSIHKSTLSRDSIRRAGVLGVVAQADRDLGVEEDVANLPDLSERFASNRRSAREKGKAGWRVVLRGGVGVGLVVNGGGVGGAKTEREMSSKPPSKPNSKPNSASAPKPQSAKSTKSKPNSAPSNPPAQSSAPAQNANPALPAQEFSRDVLIAEIAKAKKIADEEREQRNFFQIEKDKLHHFLHLALADLETARVAAEDRDRDKEEAEERWAEEVKLYKQKVKHLLYEYQTSLAHLQTSHLHHLDTTSAQHTASLSHLHADKRHLRLAHRSLETSHAESVRSLRRDHDAEISALRADYERRAGEMVAKYERRAKAVRDEMEVRRKAEVHEIEERKNGQVVAMVKMHERQFAEIKNYYNDITLNNLALINSLKEQVEEMKKKEERNEKLMSDISLENKRLTEPLQAALAQGDALRRELASYHKDKQSLTAAKTRMKALEEEAKRWRWECEVARQKCARAEGERDGVYGEFVKRVVGVQQKAGLKNMLLEQKLGTLRTSLEKRDLQLTEVLRAGNVDPAAAVRLSKKLDEVVESKNAVMRDLQFELARVTKAHNDLLRTFEAKLTEHNVPLEELGLRPLTVAPHLLSSFDEEDRRRARDRDLEVEEIRNMSAVDLSNEVEKIQKVAYNRRDLIIYAAGIGCSELQFVYELDKNFSAFPTYPLVLSFRGTSQDVIDFNASQTASPPPIPGLKVYDPSKGVHGDQSFELLKPIPLEAKDFVVKSKLTGIWDGGKGAITESTSVLYDNKGQPVAKMISSGFIIGAGGFGGPKRPKNPLDIPAPMTPPEKSVTYSTSPGQALLYRLSGDFNPLHADGAVARSTGFKDPILHGLCTYGHAARAIVSAWVNNDVARFVSIRGRFSAPVFPGETLRTDMWKVKDEGDKFLIAFQVRVVERNLVVINGGVAVLRKAAGKL
ncbi:Dynein regulatory complex subunit 4 [Gonapodya sp. JEL0774]|nr:Dynein regulatory complex subunit 4 [Gonapodya sp. JEL0774]